MISLSWSHDLTQFDMNKIVLEQFYYIWLFLSWNKWVCIDLHHIDVTQFDHEYFGLYYVDFTLDSFHIDLIDNFLVQLILLTFKTYFDQTKNFDTKKNLIKNVDKKMIKFNFLKTVLRCPWTVLLKL